MVLLCVLLRIYVHPVLEIRHSIHNTHTHTHMYNFCSDFSCGCYSNTLKNHFVIIRSLTAHNVNIQHGYHLCFGINTTWQMWYHIVVTNSTMNWPTVIAYASLRWCIRRCTCVRALISHLYQYCALENTITTIVAAATATATHQIYFVDAIPMETNNETITKGSNRVY